MSKQNNSEVTVTTITENGTTEKRTESGRFAGMTTTVKGFVIDPVQQTFEQFEVKIPYVRSCDKAAKVVAEQLNVEPPKIVSVVVCENDSVRREYDNGKVYDHTQTICYSEESAKLTLQDECYSDCVMRKITVYELFSQCWAYRVVNNETEYCTYPVRWSTGDNLTRVEQRDTLAEAAQMQLGSEYHVIGLHNVKKHASEAWAIVKLSDLKQCRKDN